MNRWIEPLARLSESWLNAENPFRCETVSALQVSTGFSGPQIEMAIDNCFGAMTAQALDAASTAWSGETTGRDSVLHVLPSNAFTAWVHGATLTLMSGHRCGLKVSSREPVFARAWHRSLQQFSPALAERVQCVAWSVAELSRWRRIVAYGADETLAKIKNLLPQGSLFAGFGHKLSVGVVFEDAWQRHSDRWLPEVLRDAEPFRLQGCLSPQILYMQNFSGTRWGDLAARLDVSPKIRPFATIEELRETLQKYTPYLSCIGVAGESLERDDLAFAVEGLGVSRICALGQMQRPPLSWENGGLSWSNVLN